MWVIIDCLYPAMIFFNFDIVFCVIFIIHFDFYFLVCLSQFSSNWIKFPLFFIYWYDWLINKLPMIIKINHRAAGRVYWSIFFFGFCSQLLFFCAQSDNMISFWSFDYSIDMCATILIKYRFPLRLIINWLIIKIDDLLVNNSSTSGYLID